MPSDGERRGHEHGGRGIDVAELEGREKQDQRPEIERQPASGDCLCSALAHVAPVSALAKASRIEGLQIVRALRPRR